MISIRQTLDSFEIMTERGMITAVGTAQLVKVLEKEFNLEIYDTILETKIEEFDDKIEDYEDRVQSLDKEVTDLRTEYLALRKEVKEKDKS